MPLTPGSRLGSYEIVAPLGSGGMGEVYRAHDAKLGRDVAIKVLPDRLTKDPEALARFAREARAIAALNHPHIVTIHSTEEHAGVRFITMELVEGQRLDRVVGARGASGLPLGEFFEIAIALADALGAAHEKHITHRDLKPSNIMVTESGRAKVLDFGLARADEAGQPGTAYDETHAALTAVGMILGTVPYMSPEQIEGKAADHRSDIFSLGIVLYEMATGARPFAGGSSPAVMSSILRDSPKPIHEVRPDVPPGVWSVVARCLAKVPSDRFQGAGEVMGELKGLRLAWESKAPDSAPAHVRFRPADLRVAVLPFGSRGGDDAAGLAEGLTDDITAGLSRFPYLQVVARPEADSARGETADAGTAKAVGARYLLEGSVRIAGAAVRFSVRLVDTAAGAHIWAETYDRPWSGAKAFELQDDIASRVAANVGDSTGVLARAMAATLAARPIEELTVDELVLRFFGLTQHFRPDEHRLVRASLERALAAEPRHAFGWACLASSYEMEISHGINVLPRSLERMAEAAARSVEIDPACMAGWRAMAGVAFISRDLHALRHAAERTVAINPLNTTTVALVGMMQAYAGDWERGLELVRRSLDLNSQPPGWFHFVLSMDHYRRGDFDAALVEAKRVNMPYLAWTPLAIAAAAGQLGAVADARAAVELLRAQHPDLLDSERLRTFWRKWQWDRDLVDRLVEGVAKAKGLETSA